jgi:hypothetical protein
MMELHLKIVGILLILLALLHLVIPRYFNWSDELKSLTLITKQILYVHTFFIAFVVLLLGVLCINSASELVQTNLGRTLCLGLFGFWLTRLFFQFFVYSSKVWKGKTFETTVHILFSLLWGYFTLVFFLVYYQSPTL